MTGSVVARSKSPIERVGAQLFKVLQRSLALNEYGAAQLTLGNVATELFHRKALIYTFNY